jgi:hypothetical protein
MVIFNILFVCCMHTLICVVGLLFALSFVLMWMQDSSVNYSPEISGGQVHSTPARATHPAHFGFRRLSPSVLRARDPYYSRSIHSHYPYYHRLYSRGLANNWNSHQSTNWWPWKNWKPTWWTDWSPIYYSNAYCYRVALDHCRTLQNPTAGCLRDAYYRCASTLAGGENQPQESVESVDYLPRRERPDLDDSNQQTPMDNDYVPRK